MSSNLFAKIFCVLILFIIQGCASLNANLNGQTSISLNNEKTLVFPFKDPSFNGRQMPGIGTAFAETFVSKLQAKGIKSELARSNNFTSNNNIESQAACSYAAEKGYSVAIIGIVTEWIDGATNWSGTVDVAGVTANIYTTENCKFAGSASGRQNGQWMTLINAPTTRFYDPLSNKLAEALIQ